MKTQKQKRQKETQQKERIQVILDGKKVTGTRRFIREEIDSLRQVVEYRGRRLQDPYLYRSNAAPAAMLWEARRILATLYEESRAEEPVSPFAKTTTKHGHKGLWLGPLD